LAGARLILWDVDHTLIATRGVGREIFREAFEQATGRPMERMADVSGRTEPDIFRETLALHSIEPSEQLYARFAEALAAGHAAKINLLRQRGRALPGAAAALEALHAIPGVIQSVLTGNLKPVAITKLAALGLDAHLDFEVGAYGSDDSVRANLVEIARQRATEKYRVSLDESSTVLIGDTPSDVATAHQGGAAVIAVASGRSDMEDLRAAGAEIVLADLTNTTALVKAATGTGI
jgi:phosphoglycolate phosphatase-like HAD superfamily hydrolase